jgi:lauroyl/myristoyl acyltransferase
VVVGSHTGGWDLAAALIGKKGLGEFFMLQHQHQGLTLEKAVGQKDEGHVKRIFYNTQEFPILSVREIIKNGKPVGIMGDRPVSYQCELVPFLGGLAAFDTTPYRIASATGARVLFTFGFKAGAKTYDFFATPAIEFSPNRNNLLQCYEMTSRFALNLETLLRSYPDQWFNFYPFWSKEPSKSETGTPPRNYLKEQLNTPVEGKPESEFDSKSNAGPGSPAT